MLYFLLCSSSGDTIASFWLNLFTLVVDPPYRLQLSLSPAPILFLFEEKDLNENIDLEFVASEIKMLIPLILNSVQSKGWSRGTRKLYPTLPAAKRWHPLTASKTFGEISGWAGRWDWARDCFTFLTSTRQRALSSPGNKSGYILSRENSLFSTKVCSVT